MPDPVTILSNLSQHKPVLFWLGLCVALASTDLLYRFSDEGPEKVKSDLSKELLDLDVIQPAPREPETFSSLTAHWSKPPKDPAGSRGQGTSRSGIDSMLGKYDAAPVDSWRLLGVGEIASRDVAVIERRKPGGKEVEVVRLSTGEWLDGYQVLAVDPTQVYLRSDYQEKLLKLFQPADKNNTKNPSIARLPVRKRD